MPHLVVSSQKSRVVEPLTTTRHRIMRHCPKLSHLKYSFQKPCQPTTELICKIKPVGYGETLHQYERIAAGIVLKNRTRSCFSGQVSLKKQE